MAVNVNLKALSEEGVAFFGLMSNIAGRRE